MSDDRADTEASQAVLIEEQKVVHCKHDQDRKEVKNATQRD